MKPFFKPEDFINEVTGHMNISVVASRANSLLEKALGPKIYNNKNYSSFWSEQQNFNTIDSHQAYLFQIEEIKKECVKHEPIIERLLIADSHSFADIKHEKCKHCGVELIAEWKVK